MPNSIRIKESVLCTYREKHSIASHIRCECKSIWSGYMFSFPLHREPRFDGHNNEFSQLIGNSNSSNEVTTKKEVKIVKRISCEIQLGNDVVENHNQNTEHCVCAKMEAVILPFSEKIHFIYELLIFKRHPLCDEEITKKTKWKITYFMLHRPRATHNHYYVADAL